MADVLASPVGLGDALRDATLLVGATAEKSYDSLQVYARSMPGVFLHATALDALLKGRRWRSDGPAAGIAAVATFLTLSLVGFLGIRFSLPSLIALSAFALALFVGVGIVSFSRVGWVLPAGPAFFGLGALLAQEGARRYFWARGERLALREKLRREAERAERSRYLESAVAHTADGLVVTDSERQVHFANPAARALLAWGQQDGESFSSDSGGELEVRLPDGGRRWLSVIGSEVTIDDAAQRIYTLRDVTRVRELERLRSQLVATVAHELRSPLAAIRASLRMLEAGVLGPKEGEESVRVAARNTERMVRLIDDTLDAERLEHEQLPIEPVPIESWLRFVQASVEVTRPMAEEKGVTFVFDADDMDSALRGDTDRLTQVLSNLLSN
ncbi:MAG: histidine kinase dimerization/phospho-acceptor domain-containing protein, partial [Myxococcota bacterium]